MAIRNMLNEFVLLFNAIKNGFIYIFVTLPITIKDVLVIKPGNVNLPQQDLAEAVTRGEYASESYLGKDQNKDLIQIVSEKIQNIYESIPYVKKKKEEYEATLRPIVIDENGIDGVKSAEKVLYHYVARDKNGKLVKAFFPAYSKLDVYSYLTDEKMTVYEIEANKNSGFLNSNFSLFQTKFATKDLIFWLTQLSTYIKTGIPLTDGVRVLADQDKRRKYKSIYKSLIFELTTGQTFSEALKRQGNAFPPLLINMVKSSEMIGEVEKTLDDMAAYYQEQQDTKRAIIGAMAYPSVVMVFAIGIVIFMLTYIVPKFVEVYESMNAPINAITQICLDLSDFLQNNYLIIIGVVLGMAVLFFYLYKRVKAFRIGVQRLLMHLPVIGKLIVAKELNLFSRTFASLQKNNVLLTDSIDILAKITNNEIYRDLMLRTINNLIKGNKMSDTFSNHWAIPEIASFMIQTGESTGELAEMLDKVADYYQKEQKNTVGSIKTFIEPIMIISLAVVVGFILVAILVPMFDVYSTVQ